MEAIERREDAKGDAATRALGRVQQEVAELSDTIADLEALPDQVRRAHRRLSSRIEALAADAPGSGPGGEQIIELAGRLERVEEQLTELGTFPSQLLQVARRVGALDGRLTDLDREIAEAIALVARLR